MTTVTFDDDDLGQALNAMDDESRHTLPFGVIGLDADNRVIFYSRTEAAQSGRGEQMQTVGLSFFEQVAPCMAGDHFQGRIDRARAAGTLDLEFGHIGDFADRDRALQVRVVSARDGGVWLCHQRVE